MKKSITINWTRYSSKVPKQFENFFIDVQHFKYYQLPMPMLTSSDFKIKHHDN